MEILLYLIVIFVVWAIVIFNLLVRDKNRVLTAWSDIDVQLRRRYDLIPKLVEAVKQYASYESATLEAVTEMRNTGEKVSAVSERGSLETQLGNNLQRLIALAEAYPDEAGTISHQVPTIAGITLETTDLAAAKACLDQANAPYRVSDGNLCVAPAAACGVILEFVAG